MYHASCLSLALLYCLALLVYLVILVCLVLPAVVRDLLLSHPAT